jgi:hypothetical protein
MVITSRSSFVLRVLVVRKQTFALPLSQLDNYIQKDIKIA